MNRPQFNFTAVFFGLSCCLLAMRQPVAICEEPASLRIPYRSTTDVVFTEVNGAQVKADIYRPDDDRRAPCVLLIHGGAWSAGDKWNMRDHGRELAQAGYVAISINYRLAPKYKHPAQIDDCRAALRWVATAAETYQIDTSRIAVYGYSAGGHLAALLATDPAPDALPIRVAILGGAPCDFSFIPPDSRAIAHVLGGTPAQFPKVYRDAAPLNYCSTKVCPTFFFHGDSDLIVPQQASRVMFERLQTLGVETEYYAVEKQGHLVTFVHPQARRAAIEFLNKHLRQEP